MGEPTRERERERATLTTDRLRWSWCGSWPPPHHFFSSFFAPAQVLLRPLLSLSLILTYFFFSLLVVFLFCSYFIRTPPSSTNTFAFDGNAFVGNPTDITYFYFYCEVNFYLRSFLNKKSIFSRSWGDFGNSRYNKVKATTLGGVVYSFNSSIDSVRVSKGQESDSPSSLSCSLTVNGGRALHSEGVESLGTFNSH